VAALILDASVLIALLDTADAHHERSIQDAEAADQAGRQLLVPASAYSEALVAFARADRISDARKAIAAMGIRVAPLTEKIAEQAAQLRAQHEGLRLPDAMVLATAHELEGALLSYDDRLSRLARKRKQAAPPSRAQTGGGTTTSGGASG
jgi:predicted nucleic acid-binding protein